MDSGHPQLVCMQKRVAADFKLPLHPAILFARFPKLIQRIQDDFTAADSSNLTDLHHPA